MLSGVTWYSLALMTEGTSMHKEVMLLQYAFEPNEAVNNIFRCAATFGFLALVMAFKVLFTIGLPGVVAAWRKTTMDDAMKIVTAEKFLKITLSRSFGNGFFLILGWAIFALIVKKKLLLLSVFNTANSPKPASGKKRKRRQAVDPKVSPYLSKEVAIRNKLAILDRYTKVVSHIDPGHSFY